MQIQILHLQQGTPLHPSYPVSRRRVALKLHLKVQQTRVPFFQGFIGNKIVAHVPLNEHSAKLPGAKIASKTAVTPHSKQIKA